MQPDSRLEFDGPAPSLGMSVTWDADPALPGNVTDKVAVTVASFQIDHLQLLSDAGADEHTTRSSYQLRWDSHTTPTKEVFPDAPVAVYQRISLDVRPGFLSPFAYEIDGTWRDSGEDPKPFKIIDTMALSIPIDCSVALPVGGMGSVSVRVDLRDALSNIDFTRVGDQDGMLLLTGGPELTNFHDRLTRAFRLDD